MHFFFYGTLLDEDVRRAVMPHLADRLVLRPARLRGHRRLKARHGSYPVLLPDATASVSGLLAGGLDARALFRMAHFEGDRYLPQTRVIRRDDGGLQRAWIFMPAGPGEAAKRSWCLRRWRLNHKRGLLFDTTRWMSEFGVDEGRAHDMSWPFRRTIHALAASLEEPEAAPRLSDAA